MVFPVNRITLLVFTAGIAVTAAAVPAQMVVLETPLQTGNHSFYERNGVGFNFSLPSSGNIVGLGADGQPTQNGAINFSFGGLDGVTPPFGGFDPNADARFGFGRRNRNGGGFGLNFAFGQGSDSSMTTTTPIIVLQNGFNGTVTDTIQRPFVTSVIPVIGDGQQPVAAPRRAQPVAAPPADPAPAYRRTKSASSATSAALSVAEIRQRKADARRAAVDDLLQKARDAAAEGKTTVARVHYRNAARKANSEDRSSILAELEQLPKRSSQN